MVLFIWVKLMKEFMIISSVVFIFLIIGLILLLWARFVSTAGLVIKNIKIKVPKGSSFQNLKIIHFTDLHYGSTVHLNRLKKIVAKMNAEMAEIIVFTGDLVENKVVLSDREIEEVIKIFKGLKAKLGILAVPGNHDYDLPYFDQITKKLDWFILKNAHKTLYYKEKPLVFVGLDDLLNGKPNYKKAFNVDNQDQYTIVLAHEPDQVEEFRDYKFDLVLCGHSHLGQVRLPFIGALYTPIGCKKYYEAHYKIKNFDLYIDGGIGTSLLKLRFFDKPSISIYTFEDK